jgi:hypothetical protein
VPNLLAYGMILLWPLIAIILYKRFDTITATFWTIVGGYMFLPVGTAIDLPMVPAIGKDEISAIAAFIGCRFIKNERIALFGDSTLQKSLIFLLLIVPFINVFFNSAPMFNGLLWIKGLTAYDAASQVIAQYLNLLPFVVAISIVKSSEDLKKIVRLLVIAGLIYSIPILVELRLSPQLHTWIYGFFPHNFAQQIRMGGFRAVVFMGHGLQVAIFCFVCVCAAAIQLKIGKQNKKVLNVYIFLYLVAILILQKSVGAIGMGLVVAGAILFLYRSQQILIVKVHVAIFFLYPTFSILNLIPYEAIVSFISDFSVDRAESTNYRFTNEIELMQHAYKKLFIGWGGWGRNQFYNSVTDGYWIIIYGTYGAVYFYALFGLFIIGTLKGISKTTIIKNDQIVYLGLSLIVACALFDQVQNASLNSSWLWFLSGLLSSSMRKKNYQNGLVNR